MKKKKKQKIIFCPNRYLSIGGVLYPKDEILAIGKAVLDDILYVYIKTQRTMFYIDFGNSSRENIKLVEGCVEMFRQELAAFHKKSKKKNIH